MQSARLFTGKREAILVARVPGSTTRTAGFSPRGPALAGALLVALVLNELAPIPTAVAQDPPARQETPGWAIASEPPDRGVDESIREALSILDGLKDAADGEEHTGDIERINAIIVGVQSQDPANPFLSYLYGRSYAYVSRPGDAIRELQKFVETREGRNEWKAYRALGGLFVEEFPRLAKRNYEKAAALKANDTRMLLGQSRCAYKLGELSAALDFARQSVAADGGKDPKYLSQAARMLAAGEQWDEALRTADAALEAARRSERAQPGQRGPLSALERQYALSIELRQSHRPSSSRPDEILRIARHVRERGEIVRRLALLDSLKVLRGAVDGMTNPSAALLEELAVTLAELDRRDEAIEALRQVLSIDPDNQRTKEWLERLRDGVFPSPANEPR